MAMPTSTSLNAAPSSGPVSGPPPHNTPAAVQEGQMAGYAVEQTVEQTTVPSCRALPSTSGYGQALPPATAPVIERQVASTSDPSGAGFTERPAEAEPMENQSLNDLSVRISSERASYANGLRCGATIPHEQVREVMNHLQKMDKQGNLPEFEDALTFLRIPCLRQGWSGSSDDQAVKDNPINLKMLDFVAKRHSGKGIINDADQVKCSVLELFNLLLVNDHWIGNDLVRENLLDLLPFSDFNDMKFQPGYRN
ncbi:hypothetical protein [Endozoicomonas sp. GU-1]|uniref:hypothetical protein n=1 Tax=Endozoicomonas sp. GU-1 TaxID=3009078 RepID=UPI0022B37F07|nr:hypothetical protein [Endozoicomonas sp. GU-1]WBA83495.1 hypothetical protein O2T12_10400 [Endozoicomonas sp. GU-1]WBA86429.1 hypothetical protein O3276_25090 [Endozoicomonas sp. GU-1]